MVRALLGLLLLALALAAPAQADTTIKGPITFSTGLSVAGSTVTATGSGGTVTSVGLSVPGSSIFGVSGSPVTASGTLGLTTTGTQGGHLYFSSASAVSATGALTGLLLSNGSSAPSAYAGTSCTNQFPRSLSASGAATCASVANADLTNSTLTLGSTTLTLGSTTTTVSGLTLASPVFSGTVTGNGTIPNAVLVNSSITLNAGTSVGLTAPGSMALGTTNTIGATSDQPQFAGLGLGGAATGANRVAIFGSTSGRIELKVPAAAGTNALTLPAGTTDFSATGGTSNVVQQASAGAAFTVGQLAFSNISGTATAAQLPATTLATGTSVSLTAPRQYYICTGTCTVTPPVPAAGYEFCVRNDNNVATVITLAALGSSARYENTAATAYGTAGTGTFVSAGAVGDKVCIVGLDSTHYLTVSFNGTWTAS